ncbi:MAG: transcription-repair coupling factor [Acidobacteriota bacterium]
MNGLVRAFLEALDRGAGGDAGLERARGGALPFLLAGCVLRREGPLVILVPAESQARSLSSSLRALLGDSAAPDWLPAPDADPYEGLSHHPGVLLERAAVLSRALTSTRPALLLSVESLLWRVPRPGWWRSHLLVLERGTALDRRELRTRLWASGYRTVDQVGEVGEASFRGGIVDLFPPTESLPVRLEFFGDEVDSVRFFDPVSQHSLGEVQRSVLVHPLTEGVRDDGLHAALSASLGETGAFGEVRLEGLAHAGTYPTYDTEVRGEGAYFTTLADFLGPSRWVVVEASMAVHRAGLRLSDLRDSFVRHRRPPMVAPERLFLRTADVASVAQGPGVLEAGGAEPPLEATRPALRPGDPFGLLSDLGEWVRGGWRCMVFLQGQGTLRRLKELASGEGLVVEEGPPDSHDLPPGLYAALAPVEEGLSFPGQRILALTEREVFGRGRAAPEARARKQEAFSTGLRDLRVGDPVVHVEHGVGLFQGIETLVRDGHREDYLSLAYAGGGRLLVPVQRMDLVEKYVGPEGYAPPLDRLGGTAWRKSKEKVRKAVRAVAVDLLRLYAVRRTIAGHACGADSAWQEEFESQFPFDLTPDQERAVDEVKRDMESDRPMDRLVCGDVGYGKTEVAMRAAFKAVSEGLQVAVLCPTTVLALQHAERFRERFAPFPVRVAMLSRFVEAPERKRTLKEAADGELDILIGTHRILSKDVRLPRLGLLIVDEEQRFGVNHKEKIKALKSKVHVLTLTATPIPRTLQMGLSGILDMSLIQTAPKDRLAIQTSVRPFDAELVRGAIRRELQRGGQVFYVHNRVETLAAAARKVQELVPEARVTIAHGQMAERDLETVMLGFFRGDHDVLVCTTLIENGVDLPRVNTLLVEDAHALGLTQLYQLRGRIGRSDLPAYAYLLTPPGQELTGDASRRLETLQEFSELGAGFRIAAVDLELRGAGNLLGADQSGHMAAVGFDLYQRLLEEAVAEARGERPLSAVRCEIGLGLDLSVPMEYMGELNQRLAFYRELSMASSAGELGRVAAAAEDRYGPMPPEVKRMVEMTRLRLWAEGLGRRSITRRNDLLTLAFDPAAPLCAAGLVAFLSDRKGARIDPGGLLEVPLLPREEILELLDRVLTCAAPAEGTPA